jgi:hypothetical protein
MQLIAYIAISYLIRQGLKNLGVLSLHIKADIADFFNYIPLIINNVGASCMRKDALQAEHHDVLLEKIENGEIMTGRGLNQESSLARPGDTRWGSHLKTLLRILVM